MVAEKMTVLKASDGFELDAFLAEADGEKRGGIVILQEIFGVTDQLKSVARMLAEKGYDTIVPALFDRVSPKTVVPFENATDGRDIMNQVDNDKALLDIEAARQAVDSGNGVSVLGFCWGGGLVWLAASELDLKGGVSFYGTRLPTYMDHTPDCPLLFHFGETDTANTPPEVIEQVKAEVPSAETYVYAAGHAFANDARTTYVEEAAVPAWERSIDFLNRVHG